MENRFTQKTLKVGENWYFGKNERVKEDIARELNLSETETVTYARFVKNICLFKSPKKVCRRSNNSIVQTKDGQFIEIVEFLVDRTNNKEYTLFEFILQEIKFVL